jgi:hypothetical protein
LTGLAVKAWRLSASDVMRNGVAVVNGHRLLAVD